MITGVVEDVWSSWDNKGQKIYTRATINVTEVVRGEATTNQVQVEYLGGTVGDLSLSYEDMVKFEKGQSVLVFLKRTESVLGGEAYQVVGWRQGKYTVGADGIARKGGFTGSGAPPASPKVAGTANTSQGAEKMVIDNDIPVKDLIEKIKGVK